MQGGTPESAVALIEDAKALEAAGAIGIVVECVPSVVAKAMTEAVNIPIMGIGAGPGVLQAAMVCVLAVIICRKRRRAASRNTIRSDCYCRKAAQKNIQQLEKIKTDFVRQKYDKT